LTEDNKGDWTVFVVAGVLTAQSTNRREYKLLDFVKTRVVGNLEKLEILRDIRLKWCDRTYSMVFVPETNAYQRSMLGDFKRIFVDQWRLDDMRVKATPSRGDKHERLNGISGIFDNDLVRFNEAVGWRDVVSQLTFQELDHDDCADATEKALSFLQRRK
jgi:predicted phage terminase large subunit-like protein